MAEGDPRDRDGKWPPIIIVAGVAALTAFWLWLLWWGLATLIGYFAG